MKELIFFDVGQGDSILLKWEHLGKTRFGIIDCNKFLGTNKIVEHLRDNSVKTIDFIILTHFHYDHFSGLSEIFEYCINKRIRVNYFLHTFASQVLDMYDNIFKSKKVENEIKNFIEKFEALNVDEQILVNCYTKPIEIEGGISINFYSPDGKSYIEIAKRISNKRNRINTSSADINLLSTITEISFLVSKILLTSDAPKKRFKKIRGKIKEQVSLVQVPHHGSFKNIDKDFWKLLNKSENCPAVVSSGDEPKDKLPNTETIEFFVKNGFEIYSTNNVYGIKQYFDQNFKESPAQETFLDFFSTKIKTIYTKGKSETRFEGDKKFVF